MSPLSDWPQVTLLPSVPGHPHYPTAPASPHHAHGPETKAYMTPGFTVERTAGLSLKMSSCYKTSHPGQEFLSVFFTIILPVLRKKAWYIAATRKYLLNKFVE